MANAKAFAEPAFAQAWRWEKAAQEARTLLANAEQEMALIDLLAAVGEDIDRILDNLNKPAGHLHNTKLLLALSALR